MCWDEVRYAIFGFWIPVCTGIQSSWNPLSFQGRLKSVFCLFFCLLGPEQRLPMHSFFQTALDKVSCGLHCAEGRSPPVSSPDLGPDHHLVCGGTTYFLHVPSEALTLCGCFPPDAWGSSISLDGSLSVFLTLLEVISRHATCHFFSSVTFSLDGPILSLPWNHQHAKFLSLASVSVLGTMLTRLPALYFRKLSGKHLKPNLTPTFFPLNWLPLFLLVRSEKRKPSCHP